MQTVNTRISELRRLVDEAFAKLAIPAKQTELATLNEQLADGDVWADSSNAQELSKRSAALQAQIGPWLELSAQLDDMAELAKTGDASLETELSQQLDELDKDYARLRHDLLFDGPYDSHDAVLKLSAGAGGTDAQDWCEMLERMYLRWAEKAGMSTELIDRNTGDEAGIKSATYRVSGNFAYGKLRSEHGVHRLVRLSPFNADNLRQTSFALVEIMPYIEAPDEVVIDDKDLKIDVYRAGGHGGQSVNTTDSAVRVTHMPTGTVVAIQNERSQIQNKETALRILRSKLAQLQLEQHTEKLTDLQAGESASWGAQIRNYVLHPYTMVKDTRTKHEDRDASGVLDGKLDEFMASYLSLAED